jgi:transcriptional regulator with XRE-family HTH domain
MKKPFLEKLNLGGRIKDLRKQKAMTLKELAERTGVSPAMLSQVENNIVSPSISTLWNFAEALGLKIGAFFQEPEELDCVVTRAGLGTGTQRNEMPHTVPYTSLAPGIEARSMNPLLIGCEEACDFSIKELPYEGEEFLHVLEGALTVRYGGKRFELGTGDSIYYRAQVPHRIEAAQGTRFLAVLYEAHRH